MFHRVTINTRESETEFGRTRNSVETHSQRAFFLNDTQSRQINLTFLTRSKVFCY